ncbi:MAG TPA: hypothetical protein VHM90_22485, partial [Phycisphaerae bacterium]|nr:hypothetical protein [Phycisphaerae bacterium]
PHPQPPADSEPVLTQRDTGTPIAPLSRTASPALERSLEELVVQLRQQNRAADLHPDFSYSSIGALLCQIFAVIAFLIAIPTCFTRTMSMDKPADVNAAYLALFSALFWIGVAAFFQGTTIALLIYGRNKRH